MGVGGLLAIGVVERPHGIKGKIRVKYHGDAPVDLLELKEIQLGFSPDDLSQYRVLHIQTAKGLLILTLKGLTFDKAQASVGQTVWVRRDQLKPLRDGEYYWQDLIGLTVLTDDGKELGVVRTLLTTGSNEVLVCRTGGKEILIPFLQHIVHEIDLKAGSIYVHSVEGLIPD